MRLKSQQKTSYDVLRSLDEALNCISSSDTCRGEGGDVGQDPPSLSGRVGLLQRGRRGSNAALALSP